MWQLIRWGPTWHWPVNKPEGCHKLDLEMGPPRCCINKNSSGNPSPATSRSLEITEDTPWFCCISGNLNLAEYVLLLCSYINLMMSYWRRFTGTISVKWGMSAGVKHVFIIYRIRQRHWLCADPSPSYHGAPVTLGAPDRFSPTRGV